MVARKSEKANKTFFGGASDSSRRRGGFHSSGIFDKVSSSAVVKILPVFQPEFFDIFGLITFAFITIVSIFALRGQSLPRWVFIVLLLIGIGGLIVDGSVVYTFYIR